MKRLIPLLLLAALLLSSCGVLNPAPAQPTPSDDELATRVAQVLTSMPSPTLAAPVATNTPPPTFTPVPATPTQEPSATLIPTEAPTAQPTAEASTSGTPDSGGGAPLAEGTPGVGGGGPSVEETPAAGGGGPTTSGTPDAGGGGPMLTGTPDAGGGGPALIPTQPAVPPTPTAPPTVAPVQIGTPQSGGGNPSMPTPPPTVMPGGSSGGGTDMRARLGVPAFTDPMDNGNNWPTGYDPAGFTSVAFNNGQMQLTGLKTTSGWRISTYGADLRDFYIEARITPGQCKGNDRYGIYFRVPSKTNPDQGYWYGFTCDGRYALQRWDGKAKPDGVVTNLIYWKKSDAVLAGPNQTNTMGVMAIGSRIYLYANGKLLESKESSTWLQGAFGVFVGGRETPNFTIQVDEINVWTNPVAPQ